MTIVAVILLIIGGLMIYAGRNNSSPLAVIKDILTNKDVGK